ncbi:unnamed protein product [Caenorhabditis nigoni]
MAEHICEVFHSTIDGIDIGQESQIEWLIKFQPTIRHVSICDEVFISAKTLDRISKSLKVTEYFGVGSIATDEEFQITGPIPSRSITIDNSSWVTLPSIFNGTNSIIRLYESKLTPMDINTILKEWQKGTKLQNLEYLEIKTSPVDSFTGEDADNYTNALFKDLDVTESGDDDERPLTVKIDDEWEYTLREIAEHICEVFRSTICFIQLADQSLVDWIMNFQPTVQYACIRNDFVTSVESLNCIFKNIKVTEHFVLQPLERDKEINVTEPIPYRSISIMDSYWVTLSSILNGNNSIICLYDSKFTPKDINTILKEWQKGSKLQNLEFLEIQAPTLLDAARYSNEILEDLNLLEHEENDGRPRTINIHSEYIYTLPEAEPVHSLMRSDGMILSIIGQHVIFEGGKTTIILDMQVWRKQS